MSEQEQVSILALFPIPVVIINIGLTVLQTFRYTKMKECAIINLEILICLILLPKN